METIQLFELAAKHFFRAVAVSGLSVSTALAAEDVQLFSVGSGDISGNYYSVARAICDAFNEVDDTRRRCSPEPTAGSIYNLTMLGSEELDFALVQSDWLKAAYEGSKPFTESSPRDDLRTVMWLYPEAVTIIAAPGSGIRNAIDLAGKTIDIGRPASGRNATFRSLIDQFGMDDDFFGELRQLEPSNAIEELCSGQIDAAVFVVGHPSDSVDQALNACDASIADFTGPQIQEVLAHGAVYQRSVLDLSVYGRLGETVETVSVMATLVAPESTEPSLVSDLVEAIRNDADRLMASFPVLGALDQYLDQPVGTVVPMHAAAGR
jgi:TRAP transporter TAXI family solute receptor